MPPRNRRLHFPDHAVTTVLVSHDGAAWLPECTAALAGTDPPAAARGRRRHRQQRRLGRRCSAPSLGESTVVTRPRTTGLGAAVQRRPRRLRRRPAAAGGVGRCEGMGLGPARRLRAGARGAAGAAGARRTRRRRPPSSDPRSSAGTAARLLEVGVTIDAPAAARPGSSRARSTRASTTTVGDVLAVGTAGHARAPRRVGRSSAASTRGWPLFRDDVDFGWRVNAGGRRVLVAPRAVVRHVGALSGRDRRGRRDRPADGRGRTCTWHAAGARQHLGVAGRADCRALSRRVGAARARRAAAAAFSRPRPRRARRRWPSPSGGRTS